MSNELPNRKASILVKCEGNKGIAIDQHILFSDITCSKKKAKGQNMQINEVKQYNSIYLLNVSVIQF